MTIKLRIQIIISLGNQLVDWTDDTARTWTTAEELGIDVKLVEECISDEFGSIFRDFDGVDNPIFSYEGWEYYESLKEKEEQEF